MEYLILDADWLIRTADKKRAGGIVKKKRIWLVAVDNSMNVHNSFFTQCQEVKSNIVCYHKQNHKSIKSLTLYE